MKNKKTILVGIELFSRKHNVFVLDCGQVTEAFQTTVDELPKSVTDLAEKYNIKTVNIKGGKMYSKKIGQAIQEENISKYAKQLIVNYIKK